LYVEFGIVTPDLNAAPIFWRAVRVFEGSAVLYTMTKALASVLSLPLALHRLLAPELSVKHYKDGKTQKGDNAPPELSIVATVIVVLKMVYGMDDRSRQPRHFEDPASSFPERDAFFCMLRDHLREIRDAPEGIYSVNSRRSAPDMTDTEIDTYLEFCEKALLREDGQVLNKESGFQSVAHLFPLGGRREHDPPALPSLSSSHPPSLSLYEPPGTGLAEEEDAPLLPGQDIKVFNSSDILGCLPPDYEVVLELGGYWAGVGKEAVAMLVERFERRLGRWVDQRKQKQRKDAKAK